MRYKSVTTIFFAFLLLAFTVSLYFYFTREGSWYIAILPFAIISIGLLAFKSPIDRYFFRFQDVGFQDKIKNMLQIEYPIIQEYSTEKKAEFFNRLFYFMYERDCYRVTEESDELDLYHSLIIAAPGVILGMEGKFDEARDVKRIAAYNHPFPSPKMKFLHAAEYDEEDGVLIVSLEQMLNSQRRPDIYFPINYFLWSERKLVQHAGFPEIPPHFVENFETIWGFSKESAENFLGYELRNQSAVALSAYMKRRKKLKELFPKFVEDIENYLSS